MRKLTSTATIGCAVLLSAAGMPGRFSQHPEANDQDGYRNHDQNIEGQLESLRRLCSHRRSGCAAAHPYGGTELLIGTHQVTASMPGSKWNPAPTR